MNSNLMENLIRSLAFQSPVLAVYVVGLVLSIVRWGRFPKTCALLFASMIILLVSAFAFSFLQAWLPTYYTTQRRSMSSYRSVLDGIFMVRSLIVAGGMGIWLAAVFSMRGDGANVRGFSMEDARFPQGNMPPMAPRRPGY